MLHLHCGLNVGEERAVAIAIPVAKLRITHLVQIALISASKSGLLGHVLVHK